jgi:hypothetical protein
VQKPLELRLEFGRDAIEEADEREFDQEVATSAKINWLAEWFELWTTRIRVKLRWKGQK